MTLKVILSKFITKYKRIKRILVRRNSSLIFCISMQRSGTTSVGNFFRYFGYPVAGWSVSSKHRWTTSWYNGDLESIFNSIRFKSYQVFEDDPWWAPEFYKILFHRFPKSKFILLTRDSDLWFDSMLAHSNGQTLGNTKEHCKLYRREKEFYERLDTDATFRPSANEIDNLLPLKGHEKHYKDIYELRNREIIDFFQSRAPNRLIHCDLMDPDKWRIIGRHFGIKVPKDFEMHSNKS